MSDLAWEQRALAAAEGTMTGAILRAALGKVAGRTPRFGFKAQITSDGYVMSDYTDPNNVKHIGAFVGSVSDMVANVRGLAAHLNLDIAERDAMFRCIDAWIARDWRHLTGKRQSLFSELTSGDGS